MGEVVTIQKLSEAKHLPADVLRTFGLADVAEGVKFEYRTCEDFPARPRLRTAMRGEDGSHWVTPSTLPIAIYIPPAGVRAGIDSRDLIIVEGESDCWSAWFHGVAAYGIPGPKHVDKLRFRHVKPFSVIYLLREPAAPESPTYIEGVEAYLQNIQRRLNEIGYTGSISELTMPDGLFDLSELHQDDPEQFLHRLSIAKKEARPLNKGPAGD